MSELRFDGRVAIVTGAGRGLGRAYALLLAERGAAVVVNDLGTDVAGAGSSSQPAHAVVAEIERAGGRAVASVESVATPDGAAAVVDAALSRFGRVDVLINNAGTIVLRRFTEHSVEDFRRLVDVHLLGTVNMCQAVWGAMAHAGYGRIVNTVSSAMLGMRKLSGYGAAKAAVHGLTMSLALEGQRDGVLVNAIAPAAESRMLHDNRATWGERVVAQVSQMPPELVAPVVAYLAHESCDRAGAVYYAGGGEVYRLLTRRTRGIVSDALTPELVAERIAQVDDAQELEQP